MADTLYWLSDGGMKPIGEMDRDELLEVVEYLLKRVDAERETSTSLFALMDARHNARIVRP